MPLLILLSFVKTQDNDDKVNEANHKSPPSSGVKFSKSISFMIFVRPSDSKSRAERTAEVDWKIL